MRGMLWVLMVLLGSVIGATETPLPVEVLAIRQAPVPDAQDGLWHLGMDGMATLLLSSAGGQLADPAVDPTAQRVAVAWRRAADATFRLIVVEVLTRQVTVVTPVDGRPGDDRHPAWLADGSLVFRSTRMGQQAPGGQEAGALFLVQADGRYLRRITWDQDILGPPQVLADGRIRYLRLDGLGRTPYPVVMVMHPDGTHQRPWYVWREGAEVPHRLVAGGEAPEVGWLGGADASVLDHLWRVNRLAGIQAPQGAEAISVGAITALTEVPGLGWLAVAASTDGQEIRWGREPGRWQGHWALPGGTWVAAVPRRPRTWYGVFPSVVDHRQPTGFLYVQDVRLGTGLSAAQAARAAQVRLVSLRWPASGSGQAEPSATVLGTVPLEPDGSLFVQVPARQPLVMQVVDREGALVGSMRSWMALQPGERQSCIGCHVDERRAPPMGRSVAAFLREPRTLPATAQVPVDVTRRVLPILATRCGTCHAPARDAATPDVVWQRLRDAGWWTAMGRDLAPAAVVVEGARGGHPTIPWAEGERQVVSAWLALGATCPQPEPTIDSRARAAAWAQEEGRHLRAWNLHRYGGIEQ